MLDNYLLNAGNQSISVEQLKKVLQNKGVDKNVELIAGDINKTVPDFVKNNPGVRFSLIHLDVDIYKPSATILEFLFPLLSKGGIIIFDDYAIWEGKHVQLMNILQTRHIKYVAFHLQRLRLILSNNNPC